MTPERPLCLIVPGLDNSGPDHWQSLWESRRDDCRRVDLGCWSEPDRRVWTERLDAALAMTDGPLILVAHSLGCLTIAWWALGATAYRGTFASWMLWRRWARQWKPARTGFR